MSSKDEDMYKKLCSAEDFEELAGAGVAQPYTNNTFAKEEEKAIMM